MVFDLTSVIEVNVWYSSHETTIVYAQARCYLSQALQLYTRLEFITSFVSIFGCHKTIEGNLTRYKLDNCRCRLQTKLK